MVEVNRGLGDFSWAFIIWRCMVCGFDQDAAAPVGKGEMTILKDMESLDQVHDQYMQELKGAGQSD